MRPRIATLVALAASTSCTPTTDEPHFDIYVRPNTVMSKHGVTEDPATITAESVTDTRLARATTPSIPGGISRSAPPIVLEPSGATFDPPLEVTLELYEPHDDAIAWLCNSHEDTSCEQVPAEIVRDETGVKLKADVEHFSVLLASQPFGTNTAHSVVGDEGWDASQPVQVSLTYDDGPDIHSLELARYLHENGVQATFFVNGRRLGGPANVFGCQPSSGWGTDLWNAQQGSQYLEQILDLGHRIANHTEHHCGWEPWATPPANANYQSEVQNTQNILDQHIRDSARIMRHPYGANARCRYGELSRFDPDLLSHVAWDGEWLDWACPNGGMYGLPRLTASQCALLYRSLLDALANDQQELNLSQSPLGVGGIMPTAPIENSVRQKNRMIILLHDRLEYSVGTTYARSMAEALLPMLRSRPNTQIVPLEDTSMEVSALVRSNPGFAQRRKRGNGGGFSAPGGPSIDRALQIVDMNNDGNGDVCGRFGDGIYCAFSDGADLADQVVIYNADFKDINGWQPAQYGSTIKFPDLDGDGRFDICGRGGAGIRCVLQPDGGWRNSSGPLWNNMSLLVTEYYSDIDDSGQFSSSEAWYGSIGYADVNGDAKTDICSKDSSGIRCILGRSALPAGVLPFLVATQWTGATASMHGSTIQFADIDADGKADVCGRTASGAQCYKSNGSAFVGPAITAAEFSDANGWTDERYYRSFRVADVDGDGRADICGRAASGILCASSTGTSFLPAVQWASSFSNGDIPSVADSATLQFGDLNRSFDQSGDPLLDVCIRISNDGIHCGTNKLPARPILYPATCREAKMITANPIDGNYQLFHRRDKTRPWTAHCRDMSTNYPKEYITLVNSGGAYNYSQYTAGSASPGTNVRTYYTRIRINPQTFAVHLGDQTYSTSSGFLNHGSTVPISSMPYGVAMDCWGPTAYGVANIDLRGTPFRVPGGIFVSSGYMPSHPSGATYSFNNQVVDIIGGGYCGWTAPGPLYNPSNNQAGFAMKLEYIPPNVSPPASYPSTCQQAQAAYSTNRDGSYTLYHQNQAAKPWRAHCKNMNTGTPAEYLPLPQQTGRSNYSQFTGGGQTIATNVRTQYSRVRIDPLTLMVDTRDQTYVVSTYEPCSASTVYPQYASQEIRSMPFGTAMDCIGAGSTAGAANVDLRGTPFAVASSAFGTTGSGSAVFSADRKVVSISGGGSCGWTAAGNADPVIGAGYLQLEYP